MFKENERDSHLCYNASLAGRLSIHFSASKYLLLYITTAMEAWRGCGIVSYQEILAEILRQLQFCFIWLKFIKLIKLCTNMVGQGYHLQIYLPALEN